MLGRIGVRIGVSDCRSRRTAASLACTRVTPWMLAPSRVAVVAPVHCTSQDFRQVLAIADGLGIKPPCVLNADQTQASQENGTAPIEPRA